MSACTPCSLLPLAAQRTVLLPAITKILTVLFCDTEKSELGEHANVGVLSELATLPQGSDYNVKSDSKVGFLI